MHTFAQLKSGTLNNTTVLKLSEELTEIPDEVFKLADSLEVLDLSGNKLRALPDAFSILKKLRILFLSNNDFEVFPEVLKSLPNLDIVGFKANKIRYVAENSVPRSLRWLILTDNRIEALPTSIGTCTKLQKVMLAGNQLKELPIEMALCTNIELLRISSNAMNVFPEWLLTMPRLSWLAYSSNPFVKKVSTEKSLTAIPWSDLKIEKLLGEGASGMIYKGLWTSATNTQEVAVKVFKGAITSDGLPEDEMQACIQAENHDHLVSVLGIIKDHLDGKQGLVMNLIPEDYTNLGGPPSLVTCTRDTFAADQQFTVPQISTILKGVAAAAQHLHERGIMHGDLYAHNTLINTYNHCLFGDFGAASLYDRSDSARAFYLERMEVRAFGCLADDLLQQVTSAEKDSIQYNSVTALARQWMGEVLTERPDFKTVIVQLVEL